MPVSDSSAQTVTVDYRDTGYYVTVSSSDTVSLSVDATPTGQMVATSDTVNVITNAPEGYKLYVSATDSDLTSNGITQSFTPTTGTKTSPTTLSANTWGFSTTTQSTPVPASNSTWIGMPEIADPSNLDEAAITTAGAVDISPSGSNVPNYPNGTNIPVYYAISADTTMPTATYTTTVTYTAFGEGILPDDITGVTYMQEVTTDICNNTPEGTTARLLDRRGYGNAGSDTTTTYGVIKAKDGNCWMTDNLNLYNVTIQATDSDFTSGSFTIPATSNWGNNEYSTAKVHVGTSSGYVGVNYYNWCSAVAEASCADTTDPNTSICPNNWKLPMNGDINTNKSWTNLMSKYGFLNQSAAGLISSELGVTLYYGRWNYPNSTERNQGAVGWFWSSTPNGSGSAMTMYYWDGGSVQTSISREKGYGFTVRCVVR